MGMRKPPRDKPKATEKIKGGKFRDQRKDKI